VSHTPAGSNHTNQQQQPQPAMKRHFLLRDQQTERVCIKKWTAVQQSPTAQHRQGLAGHVLQVKSPTMTSFQRKQFRGLQALQSTTSTAQHDKHESSAPLLQYQRTATWPAPHKRCAMLPSPITHKLITATAAVRTCPVQACTCRYMHVPTTTVKGNGKRV